MEKTKQKKRLVKKMKAKITVAINLILISLAITGIAYSHWSDTIYVQGTIKILHRKLIIDSEKVLVPTGPGVGFNDSHPITYQKTPDNRTLILTCQNVTNDWEIAIGLLIHNTGTLPLNLTETQITVFNDTADLTSNFNRTTWYYGPYPQGTNFNEEGAWNGTKLEQIPPPGNVIPPIPLNYCEHAISWTIVKPLVPLADGINMTIEATPKETAL